MNSQVGKKVLGAVVATALIIVVAVVAVMAFQNWFMSYQTSLNVKAESQSTQSLSTQIETMVGSTIFIKNGYENLSINSVKVDGEDCNVTDSLTSGMQTLDISGCLDNLTTKTPEVVVVTDKGVFSKTIYIKDVNVTYTPPVASLNCSTLGLAGGEWITVPGSSTLGTTDFCVMKYEAKFVDYTGKSDTNYNTFNWNTATGDKSITSSASGGPIAVINFTESLSACENLGVGYKLITNREWMTIARNAENVGNNWFGGVVGTNFMFSGHNDNGPALALAASSDDNNGYYGTGDSLTSCDGSYYNFVVGDDTTTGRACAGQRRTLTLSNSEVIWDLSGNVWQWIDLMEDGTSIATGNACGIDGWFSFFSNDGVAECSWANGYAKTGAVDKRFEMGPLGDFNANNGMGRIYSSTSTLRALLRGGGWGDGADAGPFAAALNNAPSSAGTLIGFRCVYEP